MDTMEETLILTLECECRTSLRDILKDKHGSREQQL